MWKQNSKNGLVYECPIVSAPQTLNHNSKLIECTTIDDYFSEYHSAMFADLITHGFATETIESAVNSQNLNVTSWPIYNPKTEFFWPNNPKALDRIEKLSSKVIEVCNTNADRFIHGISSVSIAMEIGSPESALAGLIHACLKGFIIEDKRPTLDPVYYLVP